MIYFENEKLGVKFLLGDIFDRFNNIEDNSIDLIFADPPYFLSGDGVTCKSGSMQSVNKGEWDKKVSLDDVHKFNYEWIKLCRDKLKDDGTIFITGTLHNIYSVGFALQQLDFKILNDIAWFKVNPPPNLSCRYFTHATETIIWAKKNNKAKHVFNYDLMKKRNNNKQMQSLWAITPPKNVEKKFGKHPTQKPLELLDRIIVAASNEGDLVFDPFLGSGTTAIASINNKRRFIGIDNNIEYLNLAIARVNDC